MGADADVLIVGAGAAGLWCAERAARGLRGGGPRGGGAPGRVLVVEKTPRTGTKVLASGGTRCNVTTTFGPDEAARLFGPRGERFLRHAFRTLPPAEVRGRFEGWGVPLEEAPLDKVFPASGNARDVRDALEGAARGAGAEILLSAPVVGVEHDAGHWVVRTADGGALRAPRLVLAAGGMSYPGTGTTGDGYSWLRALDLEVVEPVPALVPLTSPAPWVHELTGLAWQSGQVALVGPGGPRGPGGASGASGAGGAGKRLAERRRPILFTHRGISGPGAMDVSHHVARGGRFELRFDAFPDMDREGLRRELIAAAAQPGNPRIQRAMGELTTGPMPRRMFEAFAQAAEVDPGATAGSLAKASRHRLVEALKGLPIPIDGTLGWDQAEVTAGGLALRHLNPRTMAVNGHDGLFVIGELLDVNGPIGGLSFQAAFATAELAGGALAGE